MNGRNASAWLALIAAAHVAAAAPAVAGPDGPGPAHIEAAERLVASLDGALRGGFAIDSHAMAADPVTTRSIAAGAATARAAAILPPLAPFSGPAFELVGEPIARPLPERPVRVVYTGTIVPAEAARW